MSDPKINTAIVAVMREIGAIGKDATNQQQNYKFRSIEDVYNRVQPLFAKHGIFSYPKVTAQARENRPTAKGGELHYAILTVEYTFAAEDGSSIAVTVIGEGMDSGDKASNKAMAAAHKYAICQVLNIPYQVIDPDLHTPPWAAALNGHVTTKQVNDLKKVWFEKHKDDLTGLSKDDLAGMFAHWVKGLAKEPFDVTDFRAWKREDVEACTEALA